MKAMQNDHHLPDQVEEITSTAGRTIWKLATDLVSQEKESLGKAFREREAQILAREDNLKAEIRRFEDQVKELMQSRDEQRLALEHTISDLQVTLDARKDEVSRLQQQLQMVTHRYEDAGRLLEERGKEILEKSDQIAALNMGMADANALLERSLKEGEDKERRIDHLQQELDGQEQTIRQQDGRLADLHDRLTQTERDGATLQQRLDDSNQRLEEIPRLQGQISQHEQTMAGLEEKLAAGALENTELRLELTGARTRLEEMAELREQNKALQKLLTERDGQLTAAGERCEALKAEVTAADERLEEMESLRGIMRDMEESLGAAQVTLSKRDEELAAAGERCSTLQDEKDSLEEDRRREAERADDAGSRLTRAERKIARQKDEFARTLSSSDEALREARAMIDDLEERCAVLTARAGDHDAALLKLEGKYRGAKKRIRALEHYIAEKKPKALIRFIV